jgi:hypothetical protein
MGDEVSSTFPLLQLARVGMVKTAQQKYFNHLIRLDKFGLIKKIFYYFFCFKMFSVY